jgi:hypothetical protein
MGNRCRLAREEVEGVDSEVGELFGVRAVLKTVKMRPEEDRRGLTSRRSWVVGGAAWSKGNNVRGGIRSTPSGGWFGERTPSQ